MTAFYVKAEDFIADEAKEAFSAVKGLVINDILPQLELFIEQFASDFGKAALAAAAPIAANVVSGQLTIQAAGTELVQQLTNQGITIAEQDATNVALNALRVHVNAIQTAPAVPVAAVPAS